MAAKHSPNDLRSYLEIHETVMQRLRREGFVESDDLSLAPLGGGDIKMEGQIRCEGGLVCSVEKILAIVDATDPHRPLVQTVRFAYNVHVGGHHNLFRYDNVHRHPGHPDASHRHAFDWRTGEAGPVRWIGPDWPTLGEVLEEMRTWFWEHRDELAGQLSPHAE